MLWYLIVLWHLMYKIIFYRDLFKNVNLNIIENLEKHSATTIFNNVQYTPFIWTLFVCLNQNFSQCLQLDYLNEFPLNSLI